MFEVSKSVLVLFAVAAALTRIEKEHDGDLVGMVNAFGWPDPRNPTPDAPVPEDELISLNAIIESDFVGTINVPGFPDAPGWPEPNKPTPDPAPEGSFDNSNVDIQAGIDNSSHIGHHTLDTPSHIGESFWRLLTTGS